MNTEEYIDIGVLHDYCTDNLPPSGRAEVERMCEQYPEVNKELQQLQNVLEKLAEGTAKEPAQETKQHIWNTLNNINKERAGDLNDLPVINKYSDYNNWKRMVSPLMPEHFPGETLYVPLRNSDGIMQSLVISYENAEDEKHEHEKESFLLLEGECECCVGDDLVHLRAGGFIEMPLNINHNVKLLTPYVVVIFQRIAV